MTAIIIHCQWRIQDFPQGGAPTPKSAIIFQFFAEKCMKMKEFGPPGGGARPWRPPLDPPMIVVIGKNFLFPLLLEAQSDKYIGHMIMENLIS